MWPERPAPGILVCEALSGLFPPGRQLDAGEVSAGPAPPRQGPRESSRPVIEPFRLVAEETHTTRTIRLFLLFEAAIFVAAALVHFGILTDGYEHQAAGVAESVIAFVLLTGLALTCIGPATKRRPGRSGAGANWHAGRRLHHRHRRRPAYDTRYRLPRWDRGRIGLRAGRCKARLSQVKPAVPDSLAACHARLASIIRPEIEPLEVIRRVEEHRQYWRPDPVRAVLLAESHVFMEVAEPGPPSQSTLMIKCHIWSIPPVKVQLIS